MNACTTERVEPTELPELPELAELAGAPDSCGAQVPVHVPCALCSPPITSAPVGLRKDSGCGCIGRLGSS